MGFWVQIQDAGHRLLAARAEPVTTSATALAPEARLAGGYALALELAQEELLDGQGERRGGRPLEEARERQPDAELPLQAMADARQEERAAAQRAGRV